MSLCGAAISARDHHGPTFEQNQATISEPETGTRLIILAEISGGMREHTTNTPNVDSVYNQGFGHEHRDEDGRHGTMRTVAGVRPIDQREPARAFEMS